MKKLIVAGILAAVLTACGVEPQQPQWVAHRETVQEYAPTDATTGTLTTDGGVYIFRSGGPFPVSGEVVRVSKFEPSSFHLAMIEGQSVLGIGEIQR